MADNGHQLTIKTDALTLTYIETGDGHFTHDNLSLSLAVDGKPRHLAARVPSICRTCKARRARSTALWETRPKNPSAMGSSHAPAGLWRTTRRAPSSIPPTSAFVDGENSPWPWVMERPAGERQDWYFFGYGHDYRKALGDYVRVAGRIPLPPRFAFGAWWSRYWAYSDQELDELVRGFHENDTPLDVFVIDMDWHISQRTAAGDGRDGSVGPIAGLDRLHVEQAALSRSRRSSSTNCMTKV